MKNAVIRFRYFFFLFLIVFMSAFNACSKQNPSNPAAPAATPTATQEVFSPTVTVTLTVTPFYSETITATQTATITVSSTPTASPTKISAVNLRINAGIYMGNGPDCAQPGLKWFVTVYNTYSGLDFEYAQVVIKNISQTYQVSLPWTELCGGGSKKYYASAGIDYTVGDTYRVEVTIDGTTYTAERVNTFGNLNLSSDGLTLNWTGTASANGMVSGNACSNFNVSGIAPYTFLPSCYPSPDTYYMVSSLSDRQTLSPAVFSGTEADSSFSFTNVINETIIIP